MTDDSTNPTNHPRLSCRASTIDAILSVTLARLCPRGKIGSFVLLRSISITFNRSK